MYFVQFTDPWVVVWRGSTDVAEVLRMCQNSLMDGNQYLEHCYEQLHKKMKELVQKCRFVSLVNHLNDKNGLSYQAHACTLWSPVGGCWSTPERGFPGELSYEQVNVVDVHR